MVSSATRGQYIRHELPLPFFLEVQQEKMGGPKGQRWQTNGHLLACILFKKSYVMLHLISFKKEIGEHVGTGKGSFN